MVRMKKTPSVSREPRLFLHPAEEQRARAAAW
jgi:hypothetical protein